MFSDTSILTLHAAVTIMMTGLIWFVQIVHYPLLARVGTDQFISYEAHHVQRTGRIVGPLMLLEMALANVLVMGVVESVPARVAGLGLALVIAIWLSTAFVQVPCHRRLEKGFDLVTWKRLVNSNWWRTALWSVRSTLALMMLLPELGS